MRLPTWILLPLLAGCSTPPSVDAERLAAHDALHRAELAAFQSEQRAFPARTPIPQRTEDPELGTLILTDRELLGRPGHAFVRVRFTYVNTSGVRHESVRAALYVYDPETGKGWGESLEMRLPYRYSLTPDSTYTSWLDVPTTGAELEEGWSWELVLEK